MTPTQSDGYPYEHANGHRLRVPRRSHSRDANSDPDHRVSRCSGNTAHSHADGHHNADRDTDSNAYR